MERFENFAFQNFKMQKMNISWNINIKYVTNVSLRVDSPNMQDDACH